MAEFREIQSVLDLFQKHILHRSKRPENRRITQRPPHLSAWRKWTVNAPRPIDRWGEAELVKYDLSDTANEEDKLGYALQRLVKTIQKYKKDIATEQAAAHVNHRADLRRLGSIWNRI